MSTTPQIFETNSPKRWRVVKWISRILLYSFCILIPIIIIAFFQKKPLLPKLLSLVKSDSTSSFQKNKNNAKAETKKYAGIPKILEIGNTINDTKNSSQKIRAAFYVNWDASAKNSLAKHIHQLNMVVPDWFAIDPVGDSLIVNIDAIALEWMKKFPVKVVPMITNLNETKGDDNWDNQLLVNTVNNSEKRHKLVADIVKAIQHYQLDGINVDFEEWGNNTSAGIILFQKELYAALHPLQKIVTQDILPTNECAEAATLAKHNDYVFVMAYNQHNDQSNPGDIAELQWVETVLENAITKIPANKLIVCLAGYGYDWEEGSIATPIKYTEALSLALNHKATIDFDNNTYNSHFEYTDDAEQYHEVYFIDASGIFNTMRLADEMQMAGTALWRLGSEDERMWTFYNRELDAKSLQKKPFAFSQMQQVAYQENTPTYVGEGEVLDVQSYPQSGKISLEIDSIDFLISEQKYTQLPTQYVIKKWGVVHNQVVLTFDDGPDEKYTPRILDILEKEKVPATFFITGANAQENLPIIKRIFKDGFEIGNHTFSHPNISKVSASRAIMEMKSTRLLIEAITGKSTVLFRAPYNADSEPTSVAEIIPIGLSKQANYYTIGESIDSRDWEENIGADSIYSRVVQQYESNKNKGIILMHDAGGNREATILALPKIIKYFKKNNVAITTVGTILGKTPEEIMPSVSQNFASVNSGIATFIFYAKKIISWVFSFALFLGLLRICIVVVLAILQKIKSRKEKLVLALNKLQPAVTIIVPAYNESITIEKTIDNLLQTEYPNYNVMFVDDGSKDDTVEKVKSTFGHFSKIKIYAKQNGGKASALNYGISLCETEFVVCIDADTVLLPNAIAQMMQFFTHQNVGAVAGNVKVGNKKNMLTNWQSIEYITAQNIDRLALDYINGITIVPGAIGAFRKSAIVKAGGFTSDTLAEDCDLTIRMNKQGFTIRNCNTAIAMTEVPETVKPLLQQRFRWNYGVMQSFWKNKNACFNPKYKGLGMFGLPNILLFQIVLPLLSPLADLLFFTSLLWQNNAVMQNSSLVSNYLYLLLVDLIFSGIAFYFEGEPFRKLLYVIPQRLIYKPLMYIVIFKSVKRALKGEMQLWGSIKRTGNVKSIPTS